MVGEAEGTADLGNAACPGRSAWSVDLPPPENDGRREEGEGYGAGPGAIADQFENQHDAAQFG